MAEEKNVTNFREGDRVEFRCLGYVRNVTTASVHVSLDDLDFAADMPVPPRMLNNLSDAREMTLEEAMELDVDDELVKAIERVLGDLFWHAGKIAEPHPSAQEVALAAIDAVYSFHKKYYSRHATSQEPSGAA
jgi:hypothetical protein